MHYELSLVNQIIKNHLTQDNDLNEKLELVRINITNFITNSCKGRSSYYISKSMVFILHHVVTLSDSNFNVWSGAGELADAREFLINLRFLNQNEPCHAAIVQTQGVFHGRCISITAELAAQANDKFLRFSQLNQTGAQAAEIEIFRKNVEQARKKKKKTSKFCATYRI